MQDESLANPLDLRVETVSDLTRRIRGIMSSSFRGVWVEGEVSGVNFSGQNCYFTIKDALAQLPCIYFGAVRNPRLQLVIKNGARLRLMGNIDVFLQRGSYSLHVSSVTPVGEGELMLRFIDLKNKLEAEGLFRPELKRPIPKMPGVVGVVTSPTGAVIRDILNVTRRRYAGIHILLAPARVQGVGAEKEIVAGIELLNRVEPRPDVIIVARGGGSMEDLWCFNEECIARAVRASAIPVISAVGHEIDFTICDFAADLRVPTPSAAAEVVTLERKELVSKVCSLYRSLQGAIGNRLETSRARLRACELSRVFTAPEAFVNERSQYLDVLSARMSAEVRSFTNNLRLTLANAPSRMASALERSVSRARLSFADLSARPSALLREALSDAHLRLTKLAEKPVRAIKEAQSRATLRLDPLSAKLSALSPVNVLDRGYAMVESSDGKVLTHASQVSQGDRIRTRFRDGVVESVAISGNPATPRRRKNVANDDNQPTLF